MRNIKNILICGAGLMGKNIAFVMTANPEFEVTLYDIKDVDVKEGIRKSTRELVEKGILPAEELEERLSRVYFTTDLESPAIKNADKVPIFAISAITLIGTNPAIKETKIQPPIVTKYGV